MTVGECEHPFVCLVCAFKLRSLNKNLKCIYCNTELPKVIAISDPNQTFEELNRRGPEYFDHGIYYSDDKSRWACKDLQSIRCGLKGCKKRAALPNIAAYKKHLKEEHRRYLCDLCVKNRTLMVEEHKIYRKEELDMHYNHGDYDEDDNLIFMHPYCVFCDVSYYNEEKFLAHLKQDHMKCHLCTHESFKNVYYKDYKGLETHFNMSHYLCSVPECKAKCFIVFRARSELEKHNVNVHGVKPSDYKSMLFTVEKENYEIKDNEGEDMTPMLLSQWKKVMNKEEEQDATIGYAKPIMLADLFEHYVNVQTYTVEEERNLVYEHGHKDKAKGAQKADIAFEDVKFIKLEKKHNVNFADFMYKVKQIVDPKVEKELVVYTGAYVKGGMSAKELFEKFESIFGPMLVYKYFQFYAKTLRVQKKTYELEEFLDRKLQQLPPRNKNLLLEVKTWRDFFELITSELSKNIIQRVAKKPVADKRHQVSQGRLFQLLGCIKALTMKEFIKLKYLSNFLKDQESKKNLQRCLVMPANRSTQMLDRISTDDCLIMFLYFNLASMKFEGKSITTSTKLNPNVMKLFLRHYPDVAKRYAIDAASEDEDYEEVEGRYAERKQSDEYKGKRNGKKAEANVILATKKDVLIAKDDDKFNIEDKYEFPTLAPALPKPAPPKEAKDPKKKGYNKGWGANATIIYENETTKKKALNEDFPSLEADSQPQNNIMSKMFTKKEDPLEKKFNYKANNKTEKKEPDADGRNILAEINKPAGASGLVVVKKKKRKK